MLLQVTNILKPLKGHYAITSNEHIETSSFNKEDIKAISKRFSQIHFTNNSKKPLKNKWTH